MRTTKSRIPAPPGKTMTPDELAKTLRLSRASIYTGLKNGLIPAIRIGRRYIIARSGIDEWLRTNGQQKLSA